MLKIDQGPKLVSSALVNLQQIRAQVDRDIDWLVVAHNDPAMVRRLSESMEEQAAAILQIPQSNWDFDGDGLPAAIQWSISEAGTKHLLLVGHSEAGPAEESASWSGAGSGPLSSGYERALSSARLVQDQINRSKSHFADQIAQLCEIEEVQDALVDGELRVHALFYIAQSGVFTVFDIVGQSFHPVGIQDGVG